MHYTNGLTLSFWQTLTHVLCEPDDLVQDIMQQPVSLRKYLWYHGKTSRQDSEELLKDAPDGYFLVRESTTQPNSHVLSTKHQGEILHRIIRFREDRYTYELEGTRRCFQRITELVPVLPGVLHLHSRGDTKGIMSTEFGIPKPNVWWLVTNYVCIIVLIFHTCLMSFF